MSIMGILRINNTAGKTRVSDHGTELLDALINNITDGIVYYDLLPNSHRQSAEDYYSDEIKAIEHATGKSWEEINELL